MPQIGARCDPCSTIVKQRRSSAIDLGVPHKEASARKPLRCVVERLDQRGRICIGVNIAKYVRREGAKCVGAPRGSCFGKSRMAMQNRDTAVLPLANITEARFPS